LIIPFDSGEAVNALLKGRAELKAATLYGFYDFFFVIGSIYSFSDAV